MTRSRRWRTSCASRWCRSSIYTRPRSWWSPLPPVTRRGSSPPLPSTPHLCRSRSQRRRSNFGSYTSTSRDASLQTRTSSRGGRAAPSSWPGPYSTSERAMTSGSRPDTSYTARCLISS